MNFPPLIPGIFLKRVNRFIADVRLTDGTVLPAYLPTTGRLTGALRSGCQVWLEPADGPARKTSFTLVLTELEQGGLCSVNASLANRLFEEAVRSGRLAGFECEQVEREVSWGKSRLDFRLRQGDRFCWVEVKSVTYVEKGVGMFPDAPTARGRKHLGELMKLAGEGDLVSVAFVAQRPDAAKFRPFDTVDPAFSADLREAQRQGVSVYAFRCDVSLDKIEIAAEIPVALEINGNNSKSRYDPNW